MIHVPAPRYGSDQAFWFQFGAYGSVHVLAFGRSVESALDSAVEYLADHFPGLLMDAEVEEEATRLVYEYEDAHNGECPREVQDRLSEQATVDMTEAGGHWIASWEWTVDGPLSPTDIGARVRAIRALR